MVWTQSHWSFLLGRHLELGTHSYFPSSWQNRAGQQQQQQQEEEEEEERQQQRQQRRVTIGQIVTFHDSTGRVGSWLTPLHHAHQAQVPAQQQQQQQLEERQTTSTLKARVHLAPNPLRVRFISQFQRNAWAQVWCDTA